MANLNESFRYKTWIWRGASVMVVAWVFFAIVSLLSSESWTQTLRDFIFAILFAGIAFTGRKQVQAAKTDT